RVGQSPLPHRLRADRQGRLREPRRPQGAQDAVDGEDALALPEYPAEHVPADPPGHSQPGKSVMGAEPQLVLTRLEEREAGRVACVTVSNPGKRNAMGMAGKEQLADVFRTLARDKTLRVAILSGAGERSFIAGADLAEMKDLDAKGARQEHSWTHRACD